MSIRSWVMTQLRKDSRIVEGIGEHGVKVLRPNQPAAVAFCVEPDSVNPFTTKALREAVEELPEAGMVIVTRRVVDPDVYDHVRELGVCVDTFGGFTRALWQFDDISEYVHPEEIYIQQRMAATGAVASVTRRGHRAWELERIAGLRSLTIVSHDRYELTDDGFIEILNQYPNLDLDALVITNPNAQGFGGRVVESAQHAGVSLYTLNDFVRKIRKPWT
ncbi:hypothetical protein [Actinoallomurus iriomotensis]|uniref:Uncharacterized protein n=1 Tax=Actinoallomurus iriomotensis TaxID=478107 RepID=A0A9W6RS40_9ACTN|nr:hypothetical protein [Actinoallomurus iriomotensis]GLY80595.1 hypothetical protein Airi01_088620 [Actinoallomurus iriomotensis]